MSTATMAPAQDARLAHYPVTFFAIGMGMLGLTIALRTAESAFGFGAQVSQAVLVVSAVLLGLVALGYAAKAVLQPGAVAAEWHHPVRIAFFPAIPI